MAGTDKRKQSLYFPEDMLNEIQIEANRQDRSLSWIVQQAWKHRPRRDHALPVGERRRSPGSPARTSARSGSAAPRRPPGPRTRPGASERSGAPLLF